MTIRVAIHHITEYKFDRGIEVYPHVLRLRPAPHSRTKIHSYSLKVLPGDHYLNWQQDPFGNFLARLVFPNKCRELKFEVEVIADMTVVNPFDFFIEDYAENFPFDYTEQSKNELVSYLEIKEDGPLLKQWVADYRLHMAKRHEKNDSTKDEFRTIDFLVDVNQRLQKMIGYGIRMEPGIQTCEETLTLKKGSCRDTAWLLIQIFRHLGLAARFASGYLVQLTSDQKSIDGPSGPEDDFTDLHAWCEVYIPGAGWIGLDPTSGLLTGEGHIPLACTPDPVSAAPISGAVEDCEVEFDFSNQVIRVHEDPRVTKPYTDDQWQSVLALGEKVDQELKRQDVRLTTGGEPTFVSIDDMESDQWNTEALGEHKLKLSKDLLLKLRERFAPNGLLHYGQGKWYPGEEVPRWALGCFWRTDGQALWQDPSLLARVDQDYGLTVEHAEQFALLLSQTLHVNPAHITPAYEDVLHYLCLEQNQPINADLKNLDLSDDLERQRLVRVLQKGVNKVVGYTLLIDWHFGYQCWCSRFWDIRQKQLFLIPGDSPMGLRLPLASLPDVPPDDEEPLQPEDDPLSAKAALADSGKANEALRSPETHKRYQQSIKSENLRDDTKTQTQNAINSESQNPETQTPYIKADNTTRTAMCVEVRDGKLYVFLPPVGYLEHYVSLIEAVESTAAALKIPVIIEGYEPPKDVRLQKLLITPDPGVVEVNIHPSSHWQEIVDKTMTLYEAARLCRLGTEKFMLDGRHGGTGGGNHITFGGSTPADSPFLRRPDLLMSLVTYWQHHPSLSYLFSGMFIGPTSQAPRVDEARNESLYELEIAFQQMPEGEVNQLWLVDRLMRNLLVDITGNTHRSEFCIDKLFSPGSLSGRQGLLEFRGFEMPPHAQMSLVQTLLMQCLISRFWKQPYKKPLVRWGTALHDRFMLPHYIWSDIKDVVQDLNDNGYEFDLAWLAPFEEFRFPHYGRVQLDDIELELRWAVEPWHVLGEEIGSFGTARFVDSSVERLQVKVKGLIPGRYVLACNGRRVNLNPTGVSGEFVAGIRYRAWQPPSALHPTIGIHSPLVFDVIDTWNGKSIGGCSYHVSHPGGLSYDAFPVNPLEAESRRINRFTMVSHTAGPITVPPRRGALREFFPNKKVPHPMEPPMEEVNMEYPFTLDLRKASVSS